MRAAINATLRLLRETGRAWWADNALRLGAALAYYAIFSLAPLLIVAVAIAGLVFERQDAHAQIVAEISRWIGKDGAQAVSDMIRRATAPTSSVQAAILSIGIVLVGASGAFAELQQGLNELWGTGPQADRGVLGAIRARSTSFLMVLGVGLLFLLSLLVNAAMSALDRWFADHLAFTGLLKVTHLAVSVGLGTLLFAMIFKVMPDVRIAWRDVWLGAVATALLFQVGQWVIAWYLAHSAVASAFGAAGSLVMILLWVYYSSQIFFFGAEFTKVYAQIHGSHATSSQADLAPRATGEDKEKSRDRRQRVYIARL